MTAPLFLCRPGELAGVGPGDRFVLAGSEGRHATTVRRMSPGEAVLVGDGQGAVATAVVASARPGELGVVVETVAVQPRPAARFVLVQALAKDSRDEQAVEQATELGVDEVLAWQASRSVVVWRGERGQKSLRGWQQVARSAVKQSRRAWLPEVGGPLRTAEVAGRLTSASLALVLHEDAATPLAGLGLPDTGDVVLVVGPEGGIAPEELDQLGRAGATHVRLGRSVLRSSSAGPAALAVLSAAYRWR